MIDCFYVFMTVSTLKIKRGFQGYVGRHLDVSLLMSKLPQTVGLWYVCV